MQQTKQNPLVFYLRMLLYMFIALFLRLAALSPLVCLFAFPDGSALKWLWLACPVLMVFFILPPGTGRSISSVGCLGRRP